MGYFNIWGLGVKFPVGSKVLIVPAPPEFNVYSRDQGKIGIVTNIDFLSEMIGVHFGGGKPFIAGDHWNEFFEFQLEVIDV